MHDRDYASERGNRGRRGMYDRDYESDTTGWSAFVVGAFLAGGVALLLAPKTGSNLRGTLRSYASRATDEVAERGREVWGTAIERGREFVEAGRHAVGEAGRSAREYAQTGKEAWDTAVERGKEYIQTGRQAINEAERSGREYGETGNEAVRRGKETAQGGKESSQEGGRGGRNLYEPDYESDYSGWSAFLPGAFIGAGVALLLAPQTGSELRDMIRGYASRATDELAERGRAAWDTAIERGKEYMETGRQAVSEAGRTAREYAEKGKEAVGAGKEAVQGGKESNKETRPGQTTNR